MNTVQKDNDKNAVPCSSQYIKQSHNKQIEDCSVRKSEASPLQLYKFFHFISCYIALSLFSVPRTPSPPPPASDPGGRSSSPDALPLLHPARSEKVKSLSDCSCAGSEAESSAERKHSLRKAL